MQQISHLTGAFVVVSISASLGLRGHSSSLFPSNSTQADNGCNKEGAARWCRMVPSRAPVIFHFDLGPRGPKSFCYRRGPRRPPISPFLSTWEVPPHLRGAGAPRPRHAAGSREPAPRRGRGLHFPFHLGPGPWGSRDGATWHHHWRQAPMGLFTTREGLHPRAGRGPEIPPRGGISRAHPPQGGGASPLSLCFGTGRKGRAPLGAFALEKFTGAQGRSPATPSTHYTCETPPAI
eukprot:Gb_28117 [translate_table: standard]